MAPSAGYNDERNASAQFPGSTLYGSPTFGIHFAPCAGVLAGAGTYTLEMWQTPRLIFFRRNCCKMSQWETVVYIYVRIIKHTQFRMYVCPTEVAYWFARIVGPRIYVFLVGAQRRECALRARVKNDFHFARGIIFDDDYDDPKSSFCIRPPKYTTQRGDFSSSVK